jgi:hypothetical protein
LPARKITIGYPVKTGPLAQTRAGFDPSAQKSQWVALPFWVRRKQVPIKKCKYCNTRMSRVVYGLPGSDEYENRDEFTEYRGCIIMGPTEDWCCSFCNAKLVPDFTPREGNCREEAPAQLTKAIEIFVERLLAVSDFSPMPKDSEEIPEIAFLCAGPSWEYALDPDPEHVARGDFLQVKVCDGITLKIYFNGTGQIINHSYADSLVVEDVARYEQDFDFPASANIAKDLDDLIVGSNLLLAVLDAVMKYKDNCTLEGCDHVYETLWETMEEHYSQLSSPNSRLYQDFPITK